MMQHIQKPTRGRGSDKPSLIDLLFSTNEDNIENISFSASLGKSDHAIIKTCYRSAPNFLRNKWISDYNKANYEKMKRIMSINWDDIFMECNDDVNLMWENFVQIYNRAETTCVPKKKLSANRKRRLDKKAKSIRRKKFRLWKRYLETKDAEVYNEYCRSKSQLSRATTRKAAKMYEESIAKSCLEHTNQSSIIQDEFII